MTNEADGMVKKEKYTREEILPYFDERQRSLYKNFPEGHFLANEKNAENAIMLITYFRRNLHRYVEERYKIKLHPYQKIMLYLMGISRVFVAIASRCTAKSFITGLYESCVSDLYPNSECAIVAKTLPQSEIIINKKIQGEMFSMSPTMRAEKDESRCKTTEGKSKVTSNNNSVIFSVGLSGASPRGNRTTSNVQEEARELDEKKINELISPFKHQRRRAFMMFPEYEKEPLLTEQPTDIYISSSISDTHWLYKRAKDAILNQLSGDDSCMIAFDYALALKHNLKTREDLVTERSKCDETTWMIEYENAVLRSNSKSYFSYDEIREAQTECKAFYPRTTDDFINKKPNPYAIPKQEGELRIVACDIAFVDRFGNDNSCYSCLRLLPEATGKSDLGTQVSYRIKVPYLEAPRGSEIRKQAIRIRQLFNDFNADYIVLDTRNGGITLLETLCRTLYDDDRCIEYPPIKCMNDEVLNKACTSPSAQPIIYSVTATSTLNSKIAVNFKGLLTEHKIDLLVAKDEGIEELRKFAPEYRKSNDPETRLFYEKPYIETMLLFDEIINLEYERTDIGLIRIRERPSKTKDRYTSVSYGCYFASELSKELLREEEVTFSTAKRCVSQIQF